MESRADFEARYANFFQIGFSPFEFLMDFAQHHQDQGTPQFHTRVITTPVYFKVLSAMLNDSLQQYEKKFGQIPNVVEP